MLRPAATLFHGHECDICQKKSNKDRVIIESELGENIFQLNHG